MELREKAIVFEKLMREFQECLKQAEPSCVTKVCVSPQCGEGSIQGKIVEVWDDTHVDVESSSAL